MTTIETKRSFAEMSAHVDAQKNNSDLSNLANALQYTKAGRQELKKRVEQLEKEFSELEAEIFDTASRVEAGEYVEYSVVKELFNRSRAISVDI